MRTSLVELHSLVLVVDDDEFEHELIEEALRLGETGFRYHVIGACDGAAGLALVPRCRPDLLIVDLQMPIMNGEELVTSLRTRGIWTPIILHSASDRLEAVAGRLGLPWLPKPWEPDALVSAIGRVASASGVELDCVGQ